ncbi:hypothetical protein P1P75_33470 [Streptomyces sp. ID05-39B]|uniref:hypothetical protein n=1 Tax=Streptomyces sp. ID05-39B TaxID=3028664 RepID=UPI0029BD3B91|nr:hypothetical protein [Streptomyces sp. ID05-39B]MDX3531184.1 hypothetical protein [Streptomyces sp. ID05-39B]
MNTPPDPHPISQSSLPPVPPPEWEFSTVLGARPDGQPGIMLLPGDTGGVVVRRRVSYGDWEPVRPDHWADEEPSGPDVCRPVEVDGETVRVRGQGELSAEAQEAITALVRVAKAKFVEEAPEQVGVLQNRLRLAHKARRAKEHQLDGIRRAMCDAGFMDEDDPYSHADLGDVIRQAGEAGPEENRRLRERLRLLTDQKVADIAGPNIELLCAEISRLKAEVGAAREFAVEMRDFCSPHGVAADYADRLVEAMDQAKEGRS